MADGRPGVHGELAPRLVEPGTNIAKDIVTTLHQAMAEKPAVERVWTTDSAIYSLVQVCGCL